MASRIAGITVEIGGDTTKLSKALESVNKTIKTTQSELKDVNKLLKLDPSNTEAVTQKQRMLKEAIEATKEKLTTLKTAAEQANQQLADGKITQDQYDALQREIVETEQNLKSLQEQAAVTNTTLAKIDAVGEKLQTVGSQVEGVGKKFLPVTAAVTGLGTAAVKTAADFDQEMSKVAAISGATGSDFDSLREKAREMGAKTKFSASEAASAMEYMAMAGWKTGDMLDGIEGIMNLAAASGEDLATTSDIVTDALTAFGLSASDSGHFADILAAASSNANTNVSMMGETFKYCAPIAGALGFSAEDTAEAIGLMANSGIKASQAGTSLRSIMNNLAGEVTFAGKNIGEVTIATSNADGSMRSLNDILADCRVAFSGLTESEKAANAESLVGKNAMSGFLALMNSGEGDINKLRGAIENCDGSAESMAETMQDNLNGQLTILKSQLEELAISFGDLLMPTIRKIVSAVQAFVDKLNSMDDSTRETILKVAALAAAIGPLLIVLGKTISTAGTALKGFSSLAKGIRLLSTRVGSASGLFGKLGAALGGVSAPVMAVVAVIGTLVAAFMHLWNTNEEFRTAITNIWNGIVEKVRGFCDQLTQRLNALGFDFKDIVEVLKAVWDGFCQVLAPVFEGAFQVVSTVLGTVLDTLIGLFDVFSNLFQGNWSGAWEAVKGIFSGIWNCIKSIFSTVLNTLKGVAYGYRKTKDGEIVIEPDEAAIVRMIFKMYQYGIPMTDILDELTFIQAPSARGKQTWNKTALKYLLENEKYIGDMRLQKWVSVDHISHRSVRNDSTVIPVYNVRNHHVPIIDRHTYQQVQRIMELKSPHGEYSRYPYFDTNIVCPLCGKKMIPRVMKVNSHKRILGCFDVDGCRGYAVKGYLVKA